MLNWVKVAGKRLSAYLLSLACGILVPLSPLAAEQWVKGDIDPVSWFSAGVTYVAGIGLVSSNRFCLITLLIAAAVLAFVYGVDMQGAYDWAQANPGKAPLKLNAIAAEGVIIGASLMYAIERIGRHLIESRPFPE